ncbi:hypothetical protein N8D56_14870 [Devosia sp. A8/3-2]|nr:hypothetical protein N8D56_14870 [Devosia sp. A8/3-2]
MTNATETLFGLNENAVMTAAMGPAINHLRVDVTDAGLSDIIRPPSPKNKAPTPPPCARSLPG